MNEIENKNIKNKKIFNFLKKYKLLNNNKIKIGIAILLSLIIVALFLGSIKNVNSTKSETNTVKTIKTNYSDYVNDLEERIKTVIGSVKGVNNVSVIVYVQNSTKFVYAEDLEEKTIENSDGSKTISKVVTKVYTKDGSITESLCVMEIYPEIIGVLIVTDGAKNEKTRLSILNAVTVLLDIENTRVEVLAGK